MPIKTIKFSDLEWGMAIYIKNDPGQSVHHLVGIIHLPGDSIRWMLASYFDEDPVIKYDFECTLKPGEVKEIPAEEDED